MTGLHLTRFGTFRSQLTISSMHAARCVQESSRACANHRRRRRLVGGWKLQQLADIALSALNLMRMSKLITT